MAAASLTDDACSTVEALLEDVEPTALAA